MSGFNSFYTLIQISNMYSVSKCHEHKIPLWNAGLCYFILKSNKFIVPLVLGMNHMFCVGGGFPDHFLRQINDSGGILAVQDFRNRQIQVIRSLLKVMDIIIYCKLMYIISKAMALCIPQNKQHFNNLNVHHDCKVPLNQF